MRWSTDASAVNFDEDAYYDDALARATPVAPMLLLATTTRMRRKTTVLVWILTNVVSAVALASQRVTATATATSLTSVECAAALVSKLLDCDGNVEDEAAFAAVTALPKARATATATPKMPSVAWRRLRCMRMPTAFVMTWTTASANTTSAAFATAQARRRLRL